MLGGAASFSLRGWGDLHAQSGSAPQPGAAADQLDKILRSKVLRVAVPKEFPPFGYTRDGILDGFDIVVARLLATDMRVSAKLEPVASGDRLVALLEDRVDFIISSLGKTAER